MRPTNRTFLVSVALSAAAGSLAAAEGGASPADPRLPEPGTYSLDPPHTFVEFKAQHKVVGTMRGRFDKTAGSIVVSKDPANCSLEVSIDASSLSTQNAMRDADVKGPDFFAAAKFPVITYKGKGIRRTARGWVIDGTLSIRDVSRIVPLEFHFNGVAPGQPGKPERVGFQATAAVQRASFGMKRELLDEIGKESKAPDVWIEIDAEALREPAAKP
jgi:polyisoprenoid-binding protein YceI